MDTFSLFSVLTWPTEKNNDASITEHMLKTNVEDVKAWLKEGDLFVVDRGFRDCLDLLHRLGFEPEMPHFLEKGKSQHTTLEANKSRLVTKIRWVIESANGRVKKWKALDHVMPNSQIPYIGDYVRIVCALCNAYRPPLVDVSSDEDLAEKMLDKLKSKNNLQDQVFTEGW